MGTADLDLKNNIMSFIIPLMLVCITVSSALTVTKKKVGDFVVLEPGNKPDTLNSIVWKHGEDRAAEWYEGDADESYYRIFEGSSVLNKSTCSLTINNLDKRFNGEYTAEINGLNPTKIEKLEVLDPVSNVKISLGHDCKDKESDNCTLTCEGTGDDTLTYSWTPSLPSFSVVKVLKGENSKEYTCIVSNPVSSKEGHCTVPAKPKPKPSVGWTLLIIFIVVLILLLLVVAVWTNIPNTVFAGGERFGRGFCRQFYSGTPDEEAAVPKPPTDGNNEPKTNDDAEVNDITVPSAHEPTHALGGAKKVVAGGGEGGGGGGGDKTHDVETTNNTTESAYGTGTDTDETTNNTTEPAYGTGTDADAINKGKGDGVDDNTADTEKKLDGTATNAGATSNETGLDTSIDAYHADVNRRNGASEQDEESPEEKLMPGDPAATTKDANEGTEASENGEANMPLLNNTERDNS